MESKEDVKQLQLSKSILDMKFMKKTKDRVRKEEEDAEGKAMYSNEITEEMKKGGNIVFTETSITHCKDLIEGRLSFGGMNPDIEKLMLNDFAKRMQEVEKKKETDVSDYQMAQEYSTVVNTISNKFAKKRNRNKKEFMKPMDE